MRDGAPELSRDFADYFANSISAAQQRGVESAANGWGRNQLWPSAFRHSDGLWRLQARRSGTRGL